jgi:hypothetical protein
VKAGRAAVQEALHGATCGKAALGDARNFVTIASKNRRKSIIKTVKNCVNTSANGEKSFRAASRGIAPNIKDS